MRYLILGLIVSFQVSALTFEKYRTTPDGIFTQKFILENNSRKLEKNSNNFDVSFDDYGVGFYSLDKTNEKYNALLKKLEAYGQKFATVDAFLKTKESSFNDVAGPGKHEAILIVNGYKVLPDSQFYADIDGIFKELRSMDWKIEKGLRVNKELTKLEEFSKGKVIKTSKYDKDFYCKTNSKPVECVYYGGGRFIVR